MLFNRQSTYARMLIWWKQHMIVWGKARLLFSAIEINSIGLAFAPSPYHSNYAYALSSSKDVRTQVKKLNLYKIFKSPNSVTLASLSCVSTFGRSSIPVSFWHDTASPPVSSQLDWGEFINCLEITEGTGESSLRPKKKYVCFLSPGRP